MKQSQDASNRQRKAWFVNIVGDKYADEDFAWVEYASTRNRARYWASLDGCEYSKIRAVRAPEKDEWLPAQHPIVEELHNEEKHILMHMYSRGRTHYAACSSDPDIARLKERGLLNGPARVTWAPDDYYQLNWMGKRVAASMAPLYPREARHE